MWEIFMPNLVEVKVLTMLKYISLEHINIACLSFSFEN